MFENTLSGKTAVLVGGAGGIGSVAGRLLRDAGATLSIWDLAPPRADDSMAEAHYCKVDASESSALQAAAAVVERDLGSVDILVYLAGNGRQQTIDGMSTDDWDADIKLNLSGPAYAIKACAPLMRARGGGSIVIVSSLAAVRMSMNLSVAYTAAKSGLLGLTRHAAFELARDGIRVNAVLPGPVMTPLMTNKTTTSAIDYTAGTMPLGRFVMPEEVAGAILFLSSTFAGGCTGTYILVDGGCSIGVVSRDIYFAGRT